MVSENASQVIESSPFLQKHSAMIRIWHWMTFLVLTGSIITVLINATMLDPRENMAMVQNQLKGRGAEVTEQQAFAVSHEYEDKMWEIHKLLGYGLAILLVSRLIIEFAQPQEEKIRSRIKKAMRMFKLNGSNKVEYRHYLYVKRLYLLFYLILALMALTGLGLALGRDLGFTRETHQLIKTVHGLCQYFMYTFVIVHLGGVILAENSKDKGIVSGMIHGNKELEYI